MIESAVLRSRALLPSSELDRVVRELPRAFEYVEGRQDPDPEPARGTTLVATTRTGFNTVSVIVRRFPGGHHLFMIGTHPLDRERLSRALGVDLWPAKHADDVDEPT